MKNQQDCQYVRDAYRVPACIGRRVTVSGKPGIIASDQPKVTTNSVHHCRVVRDGVDGMEIKKMKKKPKTKVKLFTDSEPIQITKSVQVEIGYEVSHVTLISADQSERITLPISEAVELVEVLVDKLDDLIHNCECEFKEKRL